MARPLRLELTGGLYNVTSRGGQEDIYLLDDDRKVWLGVLGQGYERFNRECHAWWQMSNHYHLLMKAHGVAPARRQPILCNSIATPARAPCRPCNHGSPASARRT